MEMDMVVGIGSRVVTIFTTHRMKIVMTMMHVSPDAYEVCDGIDNDCDGNADAAGMCPCFFDTNNGNNYLFCNYNRTWSVAKGECAQVGYHLGYDRRCSRKYLA